MFVVEYGDERGNIARRTFQVEAEAVAAFRAYFPDSKSGDFPESAAWPLIGYVTETLATYGYVESLPYNEKRGHGTVAIAYDREH